MTKVDGEWEPAEDDSVDVTRFGFKWGGVRVTRELLNEGHRTLRIDTEKKSLQVRVTPSGLIRAELIDRENLGGDGDD